MTYDRTLMEGAWTSALVKAMAVAAVALWGCELVAGIYEREVISVDGTGAGGLAGSGGSSVVGGGGTGGSGGGGTGGSGGGTGGWDAWARRMQIRFDNTQSATPLVNFPVPVILAPDFEYGQARFDGADLRFVDADEVTQLDHEIEWWDPGGTSVVWVRVPQVNAASSTDHIWLYYGNPTASDAQDRAGVWSDGFAGVYHLSDGGPYADSLGLHPGAAAGGSGPSTVAGQLGQAVEFNGAGAPISMGDVAAYEAPVDAQLTVEVWFNTSSSKTQFVLFDEQTTGECLGWDIYFDQDDRLKTKIGVGSGACGPGYFCYASSSGSVDFEDGVWHLATVLIDRPNNRLALYVDGGPDSDGWQNTGVPNTGDACGDDMRIGTPSLTSSYTFYGMIDEVRISTVLRSFDWIVAQYLAMTGAFASFEEPEILR